MRNRYITEECNKILNFWKLEEYFTPSDYPELTLTIKEGKQDIPFDAYYNAYSTRSLPLKEYKAHNEYLRQKHKSDEKLYNRANVYCGCYKIKTFVEKMAEKCKLDMEKYAEINELSGRFYIFSVQIDLDGKLTEEGVQISPFFYAVLCMIKSEGINVNIMQEDICKLNEDVNELLKQNDIQILEFTDITIVKNIVFDKLGVENESQVGLEGASDKVYACKGLKKEDETSDFFSFYLDEIERVQKNYKNNEHVIKYTTALLSDNQKKIMIDSDVNAMKKWLEVDKFPLAKYPSKFSPTLMQQLAINIAVSEKDRNEKIFSVNGPPGTGKTTLLKEIIASNVVQMAEVLIKYGIDGGDFVFRKVESASNASYTEKYYEIPEEIAKFGILVVSNNNGAVENITLSISNMISYDNRMFNKTHKKEDYLKQEQPFLIKKSGWINVEGTENGSKDHFVKNQAERVCQLLENVLHIYTNLYETDDKIFIITPFRTVAESMRKFVIGYFSVKGYDKEMLTKWTKNCVGTVHTFQGKDANEVLFVLGCSDKSVGAMNWVVKKANILNVACTRAKYRIAFIGNLNDWKNRRYFREFIPKFIDAIDA